MQSDNIGRGKRTETTEVNPLKYSQSNLTKVPKLYNQIKDNLINRGAEQTGWIYVKG